MYESSSSPLFSYLNAVSRLPKDRNPTDISPFAVNYLFNMTKIYRKISCVQLATNQTPFSFFAVLRSISAQT